MNFAKLLEIKNKFRNPNIPLKEIKTLWFEAKGIIENLTNPSQLDLEVSVDIFNLGRKRVGVFFDRWLEGKIQPADEELDLLEEAFDEASRVFNFLATNYPHFCSLKKNKKRQEKLDLAKQFVGKEKTQRKQIKNLQSQIDALKTSPIKDNENEIKNLQRRIEEIKKNKPSSFNIPQKSTLPKSNNNYLLGVFIGFGVCLFLILIVYYYQKKS